MTSTTSPPGNSLDQAAPRAPALLIRGGFVYTADDLDRVITDGSVLAVNGEIVAVGDIATVDDAVTGLEAGVRGDLRTIDARGHMVLPGFVNAHWHEGFALRLLARTGASMPPGDHHDLPGPFALGGDIQRLSVDFDGRYPLIADLRYDEAEAIARYSLWTQLRCGTTTFGDVGSANRPEALVAATRGVGLRGSVSMWASDAACPPGAHRFQRTRDADEVLAGVEQLLGVCASDTSGRIRGMPSVPLAPNMTDELGGGMRELADRFNTPFATHLGALRNEAEVVREYFGASSIRRFAELGLLSDRLVAVHCAFADDEERRMLLEAGVHISHSPAKYGSGGESTLSSKLILELKRAGLGVSLSTDGVSLPLGGMAEAMRHAWHGHNEVWADNTALQATGALAMATRIAARGLHWDDQVGSLQEGKQADVLLVPIQDWRYLLHPRPLEALLTLGGSCDVDTVIVGGRVLLESGRATLLNEDELERNYLEALTSFSSRHGGADEVLVHALIGRHGLA